MGKEHLRSKINEVSLQETSKILDRSCGKSPRVQKTEAMARKAASKLGMPPSGMKTLLWGAWHLSEARFWEIVESSTRTGIKSPSHYACASIKAERLKLQR